MVRDQLAMAHYRLHVMEQWPDDVRTKESSLNVVRSTLATLAARSPKETTDFHCLICACELGTLVPSRRRSK